MNLYKSNNLKLTNAIFAVFFVFCCLVITFACSAKADELNFSVSPPLVELKLQAGDKKTVVFTLQNKGEVNLEITIHTEDFLSFGLEGEIKTVDNQGNPYSLKNWVQLSEQEVKLAPGEKKAIVANVLVPNNAAIGGHYGLLTFRTNELKPMGAVGQAVRGEINSLFLITIGDEATHIGKITSFSIPQFSFKSKTPVSFIVKSIGTTHLVPDITLSACDFWGNEIYKEKLAIHPILPESERIYQEFVPRKGLSPFYQIRATSTDQEGIKKAEAQVIDARNSFLAGLGTLTLTLSIFALGRKTKSKKY